MNSTEELPTLHGASGREARLQLLEEVRRQSEGDVALFYSFVERAGGDITPTDITATSEQDAFAELLALEASSHGSAQLPDVTGAPLRASRGFLDTSSLFGSWENFAQRPLTESVRQRTGMGDQVRLLAYHGARYLGWIGAFRRWGGRFGNAERRRLVPMVRRVTATLAAAEAVDTLHLPTQTAFIIANPDGHVAHTSESAAAWLSVPGFREALEASVRSLDRLGDRVDSLPLMRADSKFSRLDGEGGVHYLVCVRPAERPARRLLATLTPMQQRIAGHLCAVMERAEIAEAVGLGSESVQRHILAIYRRFGVTTASELSGAVAAKAL